MVYGLSIGRSSVCLVRRSVVTLSRPNNYTGRRPFQFYLDLSVCSVALPVRRIITKTVLCTDLVGNRFKRRPRGAEIIYRENFSAGTFCKSFHFTIGELVEGLTDGKAFKIAEFTKVGRPFHVRSLAKVL